MQPRSNVDRDVARPNTTPEREKALPMIDQDLCWAAGTFFAGPYTCTPLGASSGFSGSTFARVDATGGAWCLRRWPAATDAATLRFIHTVLRHSRDRGYFGVPRLATTATGETIVCRDGSCFDAQEWVAGAALATPEKVAGPVPNPVCPLAPERLVQLAAALAGFHRSTSDLAPSPEARRPSFAHRLAEAGRELDRQRVAIDAWARAEPDGDVRDLTWAWLSLLPEAISGAAAAPAVNGIPPDAACAAVHGDLWAPHVFFNGPSFSGFVDFESLAWESPAVDLAQVILHFNGWVERAAVLDAYADWRPLTATDEALLPAAAVLDLAGEGLWSLEALAAAAGWPPHRHSHIANLRTLLASLHALSGSNSGPVS
jgi:Ser/Thr protein kinase RdoA (MazF antagonist)